MVFETWAERDCLVQYLTDSHSYDRYPYNWAMGLASTLAHRGVYRCVQVYSTKVYSTGVQVAGGPQSGV